MPELKRLLFVTCYLDSSGVTEINRQVLSACRQEGIDIHVLTTDILPLDSTDWSFKFTDIATTITSLGRETSVSDIQEFSIILDQHRPDILFLCHSRWVYENVNLIKQDYRCPPIIDALHVREPYRIGGGFPELSGCKHVNQWLDRSIVISEDLRRLLIKRYTVPPEKIVLIPNGVDPSKFCMCDEARNELRRTYGISNGEIAIGFIGRLVYQKDPLLFVKVAHELAAIRPEARFFVVGGGPLENYMRRQVYNSSMDSRFIWMGQLPLVKDIIPAFDLLIVTSRYEGMPLVILEALAASVPVVSTNVGAIGEQLSGIIALEKRGLGLPKRLAYAGCLALSEQRTRSPLVRGQDFDIEVTAQRYLQQFRCLCR